MENISIRNDELIWSNEEKELINCCFATMDNLIYICEKENNKLKINELNEVYNKLREVCLKISI